MVDNTTRDMVIEIKSTVGQMATQLDDVHHWMNGNGKLGMKAEHAMLMKDVAALKEKEEEKKERAWKVALLGIGQIITLIGLAVALLLNLK